MRQCNFKKRQIPRGSLDAPKLTVFGQMGGKGREVRVMHVWGIYMKTRQSLNDFSDKSCTINILPLSVPSMSKLYPHTHILNDLI